MSIFCIIAVRDEQHYLPGFLSHIRDHVEGIIALDDCSTDATPTLLEQERRVLSVLRERRARTAHANEALNRYRLLKEAAGQGARWVLCADADERFERAFLERLPAEIEDGERTGKHVRHLRLVNLWNSPQFYRLDGRCGPRWAPRMFRIPDAITPRPAAMHQPWFPPELDGSPKAYMNAYHYHLRMIHRHDRVARYEKFRTVDPDNAHQSVGYGHLIDEANLRLRPVLPWRRYEGLPEDPLPTQAPRRDEPLPAFAENVDESAFDELYYLNHYPDVRSAVMAGVFASGWTHYRQYGSAEGRRWRSRARLAGLDFKTIAEQARPR